MMDSIKTDEKQSIKSTKKDKVQQSQLSMKGKSNYSFLNRFLNKHKDRNTGFAFFLKFMYSIGSISLIHSLIIASCGICIPIFFELKHYVWFSFFIVILILDTVFDYICSSYKKQRYQDRKFSELVISNLGSLINSMNIEIKSNPLWRNTIFKKTSELVCEKIKQAFKSILDCDTRVSIEYIFDKTTQNGKLETFVHMSGRRSQNRDICKPAQPLRKKTKYYSYHIFISGEPGIRLVSEEETYDPNTWFRNNDTPDIKHYIGVAVCVNGDKVAFILQIDLLEEVQFSKTNSDKDIINFIRKNLNPYINIVTQSYLLFIDGNNQMREVH